MDDMQHAAKIRELAQEFDGAIEARDTDAVVSAFTDDCEIELLGITLRGKEGARKWASWLFNSVPDIKFEPVTILVDKDTFFEEFRVIGTLPNGKVVESKQAEVLVYKDYKVKSLRIYFDRLDFADLVVDGFFSKRIVGMLKSRSLEGLVN
jgi:ketosteroid isomerase-like protein